MAPEPIPDGTQIGHVHLKVADLQRSIDFYHGVLGFEISQRVEDSAAFLSAGGYHHHIGLNTWESAGGSPPPRGSTGLYHVAIRYEKRVELADALTVAQRRLVVFGLEQHQNAVRVIDAVRVVQLNRRAHFQHCIRDLLRLKRCIRSLLHRLGALPLRTQRLVLSSQKRI